MLMKIKIKNHKYFYIFLLFYESTYKQYAKVFSLLVNHDGNGDLHFSQIHELILLDKSYLPKEIT